MRKVRKDATEALAGLLRDDMTIVAGGFGLCGIPENLIDAIVASGVKGLTVVSNNCGVDGWGLGKLLDRHAIEEDDQLLCRREQGVHAAVSGRRGRVEFNPQGTLAERIRAGGADSAFFTKTGVGTLIADGKLREFDGETYVMERGIVCDLAIVKAWKGDHEGNLVYRKTARNFNPMAATAGKVCVAEVEHGIRRRDRPGPHPHPGIFVDRIIQGSNYEKRIEQRTVRKRAPPERAHDAWPGPATRWRHAPPRSSRRTVSTSISASASRRWWRTSSPTASR